MSASSTLFSAEPAKWITPYPHDPDRKIRSSLINGLYSTWYSDDQLGRAWVDAGIAPLIASLNNAGFPTEFCCSALPEDHENMREVYSGYITILVPGKDWPFKLIEPLYLDHAGKTTVIRSRQYRGRMKADELRTAWKDLENQVEKFLLDSVADPVHSAIHQ